MADDPTPPAADPPVDPPADPAPPPADPPAHEWDYDRGMATITKLREENKAAKAEAKRASELEARLKEFEEAQLSEQEKLQKRAEEAEQKLQAANERVRTANLLTELARPEHGIVNAQAAAKLIEGVEFDDLGIPSNLAELLPQFLEANAFLRAAGATAPKPPNLNPGDGTGPAAPGALTAQEIAYAKSVGITPERYAAMKHVKTVDDYVAVNARSTT